MENKYLYITAAAVLCAILLFAELKRANRDRLLFRILAVVALAGGLLGMVLPWTYKVSLSSKPGQLNLLTRGADLGQTKDTTWFTLDSSVLRKAGSGAVTYIPSLPYYLASHPDIHTVEVRGYGLGATDLSAVKDYIYKFNAPVSPTGITSCSWPLEVKETSVLSVQGIYHNGDQAVSLLLEGLGATKDSIGIAAGATVKFSLSTQPKQLGRAIYTLIVRRGKDTVEKEKIPFEVIKAPKIKILLLSSFPDFEYKFLKNWLYENQYPVVFRARISKDKFATEQLNTTTLTARTITAGSLKGFDVVIADDEELSRLDASAVNACRSAIASGLGLLVRLNDRKPLSVFAAHFKFVAAGDSSAAALVPVLSKDEPPMRPLPQNEPFYIAQQVSDKIIVRDQKANVFLSAQLYGSGRIGVSTISSTYNWILKSEKTDYTHYWSAVLAAISRKEEETFRWKLMPERVVAREETNLIYDASSNDSIPYIVVNGQRIRPLRHAEIPYRWKGVFWPENTGWNIFKAENIPEQHFYVFGNKDWLPLRDMESIRVNSSSSVNEQQADQTVDTQHRTEKEASRWWSFTLFLLAAAYLWFETKLL